jgi:hypothetical protein
MPERYRLPPHVGVTPSLDRAVRIRVASRHHGRVTEATSPPESTDSERPDEAGPDADAIMVADADPPTSDGAGGRRWRVNKSLVVVSLVIGIGLALVTRGLLIGVTGDDRANLPEPVEEVSPVPEAEQALSQSSVFVDLLPGYTGILIIDGVELETVNVSALADDQVEPGEQVSIPAATVYEPGNATLTFTPGSSAPITEFAEGEHRVTLLYWPNDETRERARHFTWTFNVI